MKALRFYRDEEGAVLAEAMIVIGIVLLVTAAFVELSMVVWQFNQANKALQVGSRLASISDPVESTYLASQTGSGTTFDTLEPDDAHNTIVCRSATESCTGAGGTTYDKAAMDRIIYGGDGVCSPNFSGMMGMCDILPVLDPDLDRGEVVIEYDWSGLGYVDRPQGAVPIIRVTLENVAPELLLLASLIGTARITFPPFTMTSVAEDFSTLAPDLASASGGG